MALRPGTGCASGHTSGICSSSARSSTAPRCAARSRAPGRASPTAGCQRTSAKRWSTRSAARYVHGDARSKKKLTRGRTGGACASARAARRSASEMSSPMSCRTPERLDRSWAATQRAPEPCGRSMSRNSGEHMLRTGPSGCAQVPVRGLSLTRPGRRPVPRSPQPSRSARHRHHTTPQASPLQPVGSGRAGAGSGGRQVDAADRPRPGRRPAALRRAAARAAGDLDRAAALAAEPDGGRRAAHAPALPRGAAARGLRADRARPRPAARGRRPRPLGLPLGLGPAAPGRGDRRRRDPALRSGPRRPARSCGARSSCGSPTGRAPASTSCTSRTRA